MLLHNIEHIVVRRRLQIEGVVQGVGFRPFVHHLAVRLGLSGFVRNQAGEVIVEIEGAVPRLDEFHALLTQHPPPLAHIERCVLIDMPPCGTPGFCIDTSSTANGAIHFGPDIATCDSCLLELFDPLDRRYRYPFLNCTQCGPRFTIVCDTPYDRDRTTMAEFPMCAACHREFTAPANRRFHAQATACPECGPQLQLLNATGSPAQADDPIAAVATALRSGKIVALKGLGGYHLACDATNADAVARLRQRKHRDEKPFAVMLADAAQTTARCQVSPAEMSLLISPRRPIVLLRQLPTHDLAANIAPGNPYFGVMLPYTPLHHLLVHDLHALPLIMTSGNRTDEPLACADDDARQRLHGIADLILAHNRPIMCRCDDTVTRMMSGGEALIRRARGAAPTSIRLPVACSVPVLALGGQLKNTFALALGHHAFLSPHIGDLDDLQTYQAFAAMVERWQRLFRVEPALLVHDLHPDYVTTRYAQEQSVGRRLLGVQHHHAHFASALAENGLTEPAIGVVFDGTGYGSDGAIWGGEFLVGDIRSVVRYAHLRYVSLPGGDWAIRQPWRSAAAHLADAGAAAKRLVSWTDAGTLDHVLRLCQRRHALPQTSSAGRLFDAVAAIAGVRGTNTYEGQAAQALESLATTEACAGDYPFAILNGATPTAALQVDTRPLIHEVAGDAKRGVPASIIARRFHTTMVTMCAELCALAREQYGLTLVALSGGVFMNKLLLEETSERLRGAGFRLAVQQRVPTNDGGLCLGQAAVAAAVLAHAS